jgi:hypothetical protein
MSIKITTTGETHPSHSHQRRDLDFGMPVDSKRLWPITENDRENSQSSSGLSHLSSSSSPSPSSSSSLNKKTQDTESSFSSTVVGQEHHHRVCCRDKKLTFTLSKGTLILWALLMEMLFIIAYKWTGFLLTLIILGVVFVHALILWWINDTWKFMPNRFFAIGNTNNARNTPAASTTASDKTVSSSSDTQSHNIIMHQK